MDKFFPADKLLLTGNPIRRASVEIAGKREEALAFYGLKPTQKTILVTGGSLGAKTLNNCVQASLAHLENLGIQVIWQCGSYYYEQLKQELTLSEGVKLLPFLQRMDYAYAAADIIIARAGAGTISELCVVGKAAILVPSPNVAEDHQTKNALSLVHQQAALMVKDIEAAEKLMNTAIELLADSDQCESLSKHISALARLDADQVIAKQVLAIAKGK